MILLLLLYLLNELLLVPFALPSLLRFGSWGIASTRHSFEVRGITTPRNLLLLRKVIECTLDDEVGGACSVLQHRLNRRFLIS